MLIRSVLFGILIASSSLSASTAADEAARGVAPSEVKRYFAERGRTVLTFIGFSGAGYEDQQQMLRDARSVLSVHSPRKTVVNIGATSVGIGAVYDLAKQMGFETTGIVSTQALKYEAEISPHVDRVFYVTDETWGGFVGDTERLAPTSQAMVECSDVLVAIGGGAVGRDELIAAQRMNKTVRFFPAEMNHKAALAKAKSKGLPAPTEFRGDAFRVFGTGK